VVYPDIFTGQGGDSGPKRDSSLGMVRRGWSRLIQTMQGSRDEGIDGKSLSELLASMARYLRNHYGSEAGHLVKMLEDVMGRLQWGSGLSDPTTARLLDQFGERSDAFMRGYGHDAMEVRELDHGFQKTAGSLKGQISVMTQRVPRDRLVKGFRRGDAAPLVSPEPEVVVPPALVAADIGAIQRFADAFRVKRPDDGVPQQASVVTPAVPVDPPVVRKVKSVSNPFKPSGPKGEEETAIPEVAKPLPFRLKVEVPQVLDEPVAEKKKTVPENLAIPTNRTENENRFFSAFLDRRKQGDDL